MGIFGNSETIDLSQPGQVAIPEQVASVVPDAGEYFLGWLGGLLDDRTLSRLENEINARRGTNGWLASTGLDDAPQLGQKQNPLTFLRSLVGGLDAIHLGVWGTSANRGRDYKALTSTLEGLVRTQGHAAAATWAIEVRPQARLDLNYLAESLRDAWGQSHSYLTNGDVIKAFKNW